MDIKIILLHILLTDNVPFLWNYNNTICTDNASIFYCINIYKWFKHKFLQLTECISLEFWVSTRPPPFFFQKKKTPKRMNKQSRLFPILKSLNAKFGKSRTYARTWHPTGTHWVIPIQPLKSTDYIFLSGSSRFLLTSVYAGIAHTHTHCQL